MKRYLKILLVLIVFIFVIFDAISFADNEYSLTIIQNGIRITTKKSPGTIIKLTNKNEKVTGWIVDEGNITIMDGTFIMPNDNVIIRAVYGTSTYAITYDLDGGTIEGANPSTYTSSDTITLINPTKEGYIFTGWVGTDLATPTVTVIIPSGSTGNREYTATFSPICYTITTIADEGTEITGAYTNHVCTVCGGKDHECDVVNIFIEANNAEITEE